MFVFLSIYIPIHFYLSIYLFIYLSISRIYPFVQPSKASRCSLYQKENLRQSLLVRENGNCVVELGGSLRTQNHKYRKYILHKNIWIFFPFSITLYLEHLVIFFYLTQRFYTYMLSPAICWRSIWHSEHRICRKNFFRKQLRINNNAYIIKNTRDCPVSGRF